RFKKGELICREGEYGNTAFYILEGKVDIYINAAVSQIKTETAKKGWLTRMKSKLVSTNGQSDGKRQFIQVDATVGLPMDNPIAHLDEGDLFGEQTCM